MLRDREFGHVGQHPGRDQQRAARLGDAVLCVECGESSPCRVLARLERGATAREFCTELGGGSRQPGRHRHALRPMQRERSVQFRQFAGRSEHDQLVLVGSAQSLRERTRRQRELAQSCRQQVDPRVECRAGSGEQVEARHGRVRGEDHAFESLEVTTFACDGFELVDHGFGGARPLLQPAQRRARAISDDVLRTGRLQHRSWPPRQVTARQHGVLVEQGREARQHEVVAAAAARFELHRAGARQSVEHRIEFLARRQQLEPQRTGRSQAHVAFTGARTARSMTNPRRRTKSDAASHRKATVAVGVSGWRRKVCEQALLEGLHDRV